MSKLENHLNLHPVGNTAEQLSIPRPECGKLYTGVVVGTMMPNNTLEVKLDGLDEVINCVWATAIVSSLIGFKTSFMPALKTKVILLYVDEPFSYVVGALPDNFVDPGNQVRSILDPSGHSNYHRAQVFSARNSGKAQVAVSHKPPADLIEGEFNLDNLLGVGLSLLRHLASLQAGDLARVECHLLDDMVRIISDTFRQHSAFGDFEIHNDGGRLNAIWQGTSLNYEAWGLKRAEDEKGKFTDNPDQINLADIDGLTDDGRWRFSQYVGWLGNFINMWVTDPVQSIGRIAQNQLRSGKARVHINNDGSVLVQSVADIVLEKVVRIPVPIPLRKPDDPQGNRADDTPHTNVSLASWQPTSQEDLFEMAFQLRNYARWLNNTYSLSRFYEMDRDYRVPTEAQTPAPDLVAAEVDKHKANQDSHGVLSDNWKVAYSTIRIYRDGSIQTVDAYGNSILTSAIGVQISSSSDLLLQAAGSVNIVAGRDINLLAQKNIGLTAVLEKVRIKAQTGMQLFSAAGHLVLEVADGFIAKINGIFNASNNLEVDLDGTVLIPGFVFAGSVAAEISRLNGEGPHDGHLEVAGPVIIEDNSEEFKFQDNYGDSKLYETVTQQWLRKGDISGTNASWSFTSNAVSGKGSPWPGTAKQKQFDSGSSLNQPSSAANFSANAEAASEQNPQMKTK